MGLFLSFNRHFGSGGRWTRKSWEPPLVAFWPSCTQNQNNTLSLNPASVNSRHFTLTLSLFAMSCRWVIWTLPSVSICVKCSSPHVNHLDCSWHQLSHHTQVKCAALSLTSHSKIPCECVTLYFGESRIDACQLKWESTQSNTEFYTGAHSLHVFGKLNESQLI